MRETVVLLARTLVVAAEPRCDPRAHLASPACQAAVDSTQRCDSEEWGRCVERPSITGSAALRLTPGRSEDAICRETTPIGANG
jgi:hypothetical protein